MNTDVVVITSTATLKDAASLMLEHGINALPVVDAQGGVQGMIGIRDILRIPWPKWHERPVIRWDRLDDKAQQLTAVSVGQVMARPAISVAPETPIIEVIALMVNRGIHPIPVIEGGRLMGVIGRADVVRVMLKLADGAADTPTEPEPVV